MNEVALNNAQPNAPQKKRHPGRVIASIPLCLLAFLLGTLACVLMMLRTVTSEQVIENMVENINFNDIQIDLGIGNEGDGLEEYGIAPASEGDVVLDEEQAGSLAAFLQEQLNALPQVEAEISVEKVERLLDQPFAKEFISKQLSAVEGQLYRDRGDL